MKKYILIIFSLLLSFSVSGIDIKSLDKFDNWEVEKDDKPVSKPNEVKVVKAGNNNLIMLHIEKTNKTNYCRLKYNTNVVVTPGQIIELKILARAENLKDGYGLFPTIFFNDKNNDYITLATGDVYDKSGRWLELSCKAIAPTNAAKIYLGIWLHGLGTAFIKDVDLLRDAGPGVLKNIAGNRSPGTAPLQTTTLQVTDEITCNSLWGFGFEDDGWFYNDVNKKFGVNDKDYKLREKRIKWLEPDWVRMMFWHREWQPDVLKTNFTFESPNMKSHYRTLELYQKMNVPVVFAGTDWGENSLYDNPKAYAFAVGEMFDYLHKKKKLTCVKYWTMLNEPDQAPTFSDESFRKYILLHKLVKDEFKRRNLDVKIVGSDDASNINWFKRCAFDNEYYELIDVMDSHRYFRPAEVGLMADYFAGRMEIMDAHYKKKPFITCEYGFLANKTDSHYSPLMETYDYALLNAEFCIEMLNSGSAGASIWTSHSTYYADDGKMMDFGLWRYKNKNWSKRPVYYSAAMFLKNVKAGEKAYKVISDNPQKVLAGKAGDTVFWVNKSDKPEEILIKGFSATEAAIFTETKINGKKIKITNKKFKAPPRSFGYLTK